MENKELKDFIEKFNKLTPNNQKYIIAIQQALTFAQSTVSESVEKEQNCVAKTERKKLL